MSDDNVFRDRYEEDDEDEVNENNIEDDEPVIAERNAYERVGSREQLGQIIGTIFAGQGEAGKKLERIQRMQMFMNISPLEKATMIMGQLARTVFEEQIGPITNKIKIDQINTILEKIPHLKYKNPVGLLLPFYILESNKGKLTDKIDTNRLEEFATICKNQELGVTKIDLIRYCRLISNHLKYQP